MSIPRIAEIFNTIFNPVESSLDVSIQDPYSDSFDRFFGIVQKEDITLTADIDKGDFVINVSAGHGFIAGSLVHVTDSSDNNCFISKATAVATNAITLDTPANRDFAVAGTVVRRLQTNLNANGSQASPVIAKFTTFSQHVSDVDVCRLMLQMETATTPQWTDFGDITNGLTNGCVFRVVYNAGLASERIVNLFNIKRNSGIALHAYDYTIYAVGGVGIDGIASRMTWGGIDKRGVVIRLTNADELQMVIQDNLSTISTFNLIAQGHTVVV